MYVFSLKNNAMQHEISHGIGPGVLTPRGLSDAVMIIPAVIVLTGLVFL